jgi:hypothetical protein
MGWGYHSRPFFCLGTMIPTQLLWALGYKGAVIILSGDYRSNRHIIKKNDVTLCGIKTRKQKDIRVDGKFKGFVEGSATDVYGFYGAGRCKECLKAYLQRRLSKDGAKQARLYQARLALRLPQRSP